MAMASFWNVTTSSVDFPPPETAADPHLMQVKTAPDATLDEAHESEHPP